MLASQIDQGQHLSCDAVPLGGGVQSGFLMKSWFLMKSLRAQIAGRPPQGIHARMTLPDVVPSIVRSAVEVLMQVGQRFLTTDLHEHAAVRTMHPDLETLGHMGGFPTLGKWLERYGMEVGVQRAGTMGQGVAIWQRVF